MPLSEFVLNKTNQYVVKVVVLKLVVGGYVKFTNKFFERTMKQHIFLKVT